MFKHDSVGGRTRSGDGKSMSFIAILGNNYVIGVLQTCIKDSRCPTLITVMLSCLHLVYMACSVAISRALVASSRTAITVVSIQAELG